MREVTSPDILFPQWESEEKRAWLEGKLRALLRASCTSWGKSSSSLREGHDAEVAGECSLGVGVQWHLSCPLTHLFYFLC